jgi:23S rRNA pseudouridine2605 synthase
MKNKRPRPPSDSAGAEDGGDHGPGERLQKVLAAAGVGSRRDCEELIREGRVEIDRKSVTELGTRVDPLRQEIRVDGELLRQPKRQYFAVNKPIGVVTTNDDPSGRSRVIDLVPTEERVFAVGRLDRSSEGLILVTNDGEFANRITHPRYGVEKTYLVRVAGAPDHEQLARLKKGVHLAEGFARAASIAVKKQHGQSTDLVIVLNEGRNREIRRILARVGHKVLTLKRVAVGPIKLGDLPIGGWRRLMPNEVESLLEVAKEKRRDAKRKGPGVGSRGSGVGGQRPAKASGGRQPPEAIALDVGPSGPDDKYVQKQALLAEPLSLDDLLRDDMDEGPLTSADLMAPPIGDATSAEIVRGDVIDYEDEPTSLPPSEGQPPPRKPRPGPPRRDQPRQGRPRQEQMRQGPPAHAKQAAGEGRGNRGQRGERNRRADLAGLPKENFGKKRGGKRVYGVQGEGRGPAGETAGKPRFRPKHKKKSAHAEGFQQESRRGAGRGKKKQFGKPGGKPGGKRKGRR